jgi:hypothetical protein
VQREILSELQQRNIEERQKLETAVADGEALLVQVRSALRTIVESHYRLVTEDTKTSATHGSAAAAVEDAGSSSAISGLASGGGAPPTLASDGDDTKMDVDGTDASIAGGAETDANGSRGTKRPRIDE